ncbi:hypothetical protein POTOM_014329 [Populus tomentosa]|uniref:Response regulatory domain-containing protein n=1 Tax=Populus tomentosa TaxID=118781 RepID=A0A8X8A495_POPTO|nr:hypothetical protein POTOM_014329 [Populus tomentosa]
MAGKDNTQIELKSKMLFSELDHFIAKSQEKSDRSSKEIIAAKFFKIEVEASVIARNNLDQEVSVKIDKARQWLSQKMDEFKIEEDKAMAADHHKSSLQGGNKQLMTAALGISEDTLPGPWNPLPEEIERVKAAVCECLDKARVTKRLSRSSMADEDNAQIDPEIQNLVKKLDECIAKFDQKRQVLQKAIESETEALKKDQNETRELRLNLLHESGATSSSNIEAGSRKIANVKQWLNQKALISGDTGGDHDQGHVNSYSVLIVDDDRNARDTIQRYTMPVGTEKHRAMEFQEAKNGKEAVYLHLAGASFDLIIMDNQMPVMTGIQATQLLRKMGVKSPIIGVSSESDHQAFIDAGADECLKMPLDTA